MVPRKAPLSGLKNGTVLSVTAGFIAFALWLRWCHAELQRGLAAGRVVEAADIFYREVVFGAATLFFLTAAALFFFMRRAAAALERLAESAEKASSGDFSGRYSALSESDAQRLEAAVQALSDKLEQTAASLEHQRKESEAVLRIMSDGVIAVDREERILGLNEAAAWLLNLEEASGRMLHEFVRSTQLPEFVQTLFERGEASIPEIALRINDEDLTLSLRGKVLAEHDRHPAAAILVFQNLTQMKRLENVRRDFVANVSHELRTPVTSIKGFVETLLEGAMDSPVDRKKFLEIILRHTRRLNNIIDDLLALARLENAPQENSFCSERFSVSDAVAAAVEFCQSNADQKNVRLASRAPHNTYLFGSKLLIEQALINLILNAIRYSEAGDLVAVNAAIDDEQMVIEVHDTGVGIAREHLPRLFERFYRVDRARTREDGGSGLGLSIVKHIALAHGGDVKVSSELGNGSTFTLRLPASGPESSASDAARTAGVAVSTAL